jgi:predicted RNA binding protein YcfA (HicA-like mRNA interferase family)
MTTPPRGLTARQLIKALQEDGFALKRTRASHHIFLHPDGRLVVVSYHRLGDGFPIGTLKRMIDDARWADDDLRRLALLS